MKLVKTFGLAIVISTAGMAFVSVSTASATLCKVNEKPCSPANQYTTPTSILLLSTEKVVFTDLAATTCHSHATLVHEGINKEGKLYGRATLLDWSSCEGCKTMTTSQLPTLEDEAIGGGNGKIKLAGMETSLAECPFGLKCTGKVKAASLEFTGGKIGAVGGTAHVTAIKAPVAMSGFACGTEATWSALYLVTVVNGSETGSIFIE